jgi:dipeptidyl aminopeptidase/acylaminoacyl peptidase
MRRRSAHTLAAVLTAALAVSGLSGCGSSAPPKVHGLTAILGKPSGTPRGLVMLIHGGGWSGQSATAVASEAGMARFLQRTGYETLTIDYHRGAGGISDAEMFYRFARRRVGPRLPICAIGISAGAHISLMLATKIPELACVIDYAGPTDLVSLATEPRGKYGYQVAVRAFGARNLAKYSPALHAESIRAKVLLVYAKNDPLVPVAQGQVMANALPTAQLIVLPPGPMSFAHSTGGPGSNTGVATGAYYKALKTSENFLAAATRSWRPG